MSSRQEKLKARRSLPRLRPRDPAKGPSMVPFYLIATAIVVGGGVLSYRQVTRVPLDVHSQAGARLPPRPATEAESTTPPQPFKGEGPWVLAVLPACFEQTQRVDGPRAFVQARFPHAARPLAAGTALQAGNCALAGEHAAWVITRGSDRFKLSGDVSLYRDGDTIVTYRENGQLAELRMYRILK